MTQLNPDDTLSYARAIRRSVTRAPRVALQGQAQINIVRKAEAQVLSPPDRTICDCDPALAGLPLLLDADALAAVLGCGTLVPVYLRDKPGVSCTAAYLCADGQAVAAYAYGSARYAEESRRSRWRGEPSDVMLPEHGVIVIPARLDRHLRALKRFLDPAQLQKALRRVVGVLPDLAAADLVLLRYKPGRRMVARLDLQGQPCGVLKVMAGRAFDGALIGATAAMADGQAPLLGADAALGAMLTAWIPGHPVCPEMTGHAPDRTTVAQIGTVLAALHASPFRPATEWTAQANAEAVMTAAADLMPLDADLATRAQALATPLAARLAGTAFDPVLVHGDFSADQVVMGDVAPVILDWDNVGLGDPARDLGSFLARMDAQVIDGLLTQDQADDRGAALPQGYGTVPTSMALHHARALMLLLTEGFRNRHPDWSARTQKMMVRIEQVLGTVTTHHASGMRGS